MSDLSITEYLKKLEMEERDTPRLKRIIDGSESVRIVLEEFSDEIKHTRFRKRIRKILDRNTREIRPFENGLHEKSFKAILTDRNVFNKEYLAAVYLLTSDNRTWRKVKAYMNDDGVSYKAVKDIPSDNGYALFQLARDLTEGTEHISLSEIYSGAGIDTRMFMVITKALCIYRYGVGAIGIDKSII